MRRFVGIGAAWLAATLVAVAVAAAAVGSVRSEVTDVPTALGAPTIAAQSAVASDAPDPSTTASTAAIAPPTTVALDDPHETTTTTADTDVPAESPATTTTAPDPTTTTTTTSSYTKTYDTGAGSVRITVSGEAVTFAGATPLPGWTVELENDGPEEVKVHFERNKGEEDEEEEIEFKATVEDGELKVSISEES